MANLPGPDENKAQKQAAGTPARKRAARGSGISSEISFDEQVEIIGQINRVVAKNKIEITTDTFTFSAKKRGGLIPLVINLCALAVTITAGAILIRYFDRQEASLVIESARVLTAEAKLIEAVREESEARLSEKDAEIARIRGRLAELDEERRRLQLDSDAQVKQREEELRIEMERLLAEERSKLQEEGVSVVDIRQQLSALEASLDAENRSEIAALQERSSRELAARDEELADLQEQLRERESELETRFEEETGRLESERSRIDAQLSRLREERQQEELVLDQLLAGYARVEEDLQGGRTPAALRGLDNLEGLLATPAIAALPAVRQRLSLDRFTIASLRELIAAREAALAGRAAAGEAEQLLADIKATVAEADRAASAGDDSAALGFYTQALAAVPDLRRSHEALLAAAAETAAVAAGEAAGEAAAAAEATAEAKRQLASARAEIRRLSTELGDARAAAEARRALTDRLEALRRRYQEISGGSVSERLSQEQVLALVETKLRVREAMTSEPMTSRYPELYAALENYLDAFAADQQARAQDEALKDVISILKGLASRPGNLDARLQDLQGSYSTPGGDLLAELLSELAALLK